MKTLRFLLAFVLIISAGIAAPPAREIPQPLRAWEQWATWDDLDRDCPTPYSDAKKHLCVWPSQLALQVEHTGAQFTLGVVVYMETWVRLPGSSEAWPVEVKVDGVAVPVLEHEGAPAIQLAPGSPQLTGRFAWSDFPQRLALPREIGLLALTLDGQPVAAPVWDAEGNLWLRRDGSTEQAAQDFLSTKISAVLEDGIPLWWRAEIELTVSGKSREETLGTVLPEGWKLASVDSPIPAAIDAAGQMKAQVRAGKWIVKLAAFRFDQVKDIAFAAGAKPAVTEQFVGFRARPDLRTVEITGAPSVDVSQITFPEQWRELPVYRWDAGTTLHLEERLRGMGDQPPPGLGIAREWWLDEDGRGLTFRDQLSGAGQRIWRLDAAAGQELGAVRSAGQGQLITRNPQTAAPGVEIRTRELNLDATGRMPRAAALPATGWRADAESLEVTLNLPPGWRLLALFGADWVHGDWLTAWSLLDLFLLLIFSLAVFRLWGVAAGVLAFLAFGLAYHEPFAPHYVWLIVLIPLALQRVVPAGRLHRVVILGKWAALAALALVLVPFITAQIQQAVYPQLEVVGTPGEGEGMEMRAPPMVAREAAPTDFASPAEMPAAASNASVVADRRAYANGPSAKVMSAAVLSSAANTNLAYDTKARIQTGPGVPEWKWREVSFGWNGPVTEAQQVRPVLISLAMERVLSALRVGLLLALAALLLGVKKLRGITFRPGAKAAALLVALAVISTSAARAQMPDQATLNKLRERLLKPSDAYPHAADISNATLTLRERKLTIDAEIHAAIRTAVPVPGRLPAWSPVAVAVDDQAATALRREDGFLWVVLEPGVHRIHVEGAVGGASEWEWTYPLKPRQVKIDATEWSFTGVRPDGTPEAQIFLTRKEKTAASALTYERQDLESVASIDRHLELGLIWQVRNTVRRLSPAGRALALRVPLLPGENVLTPNAVVRDGFIEVRLGAQDTVAAWESGLAVMPTLALATRANDTWVERWELVASPVWNVALTGLPPIFEPSNHELAPVWQPWPGESATLAISRPEAIAGATITVNRGTHDLSLGRRQRTEKLDLALRCSLGEDFLVALPAGAEVTALSLNAQAIPVRQDAGKLIIPVRPGEQSVSIAWKTNAALGTRAEAGEVRLPVESANLTTIIHVPEDRWVLWTSGPRLGPAVRFWGVLIFSLLVALGLGRAAHSPLRTGAWLLLAIGLTQVPVFAALVVVGWLFFLVWRGTAAFLALPRWAFNLLQVLLIALTAGAIGILFTAVGEGLLGNPEMFISGNGSEPHTLRWFQARSAGTLPQPGCLSVSIWWYRLLMLGWALWLAAALLRWLRWGWEQFCAGGCFRRKPKVVVPPPPLPVRG